MIKDESNGSSSSTIRIRLHLNFSYSVLLYNFPFWHFLPLFLGGMVFLVSSLHFKAGYIYFFHTHWMCVFAHNKWGIIWPATKKNPDEKRDERLSLCMPRPWVTFPYRRSPGNPVFYVENEAIPVHVTVYPHLPLANVYICMHSVINYNNGLLIGIENSLQRKNKEQQCRLPKKNMGSRKKPPPFGKHRSNFIYQCIRAHLISIMWMCADRQVQTN